MIDQELDEVIRQASREGAGSSRYVKRMLEIMEYDVPYTSNEIMALLGIKSKETLRRNYLHPAIEEGLIQTTVPDKPNSKNQRYVKK